MRTPSSGPSERVALLVTSVASFLTPFMGAAVTVTLPSIAREFGLSAVAMSWVATAYLLAAAAFLVPFGKIADIHGRKSVFAWGMVVYSATSLLCGLTSSGPLLIGARALQGVGAAMIFSTTVAILTSVFPAEKRGAALGINVAAVYLGLSLGPVLGGLLTEQLGWRALFHSSAVLGAISVVVVLWKLPGEWAEARGETLDVAGSALYGLGLVAVMYGLSRLSTWAGVGFFALGVGALAAFTLRALRAPAPILDVRLFRENRVFAFSNLAALVNYSATAAIGFLLSLHLQYVKGLSPQGAGLILVAQPIVQTVVSPFAGRLSDRVEPRIVASAGMALIVSGLALLAFLTGTTPLGYLVACLSVLGCGFGLFTSPNTNAVMGAVEKKLYGVASATLATMRLSGQMLSMGIATLVLAVFIGREPITPARHAAFLAGVRTAFAVFAALCVGGTFASLARGRSRK